LMEHATDLHNGQPPSYHQIDYWFWRQLRK
jgi:hypothetical protein